MDGIARKRAREAESGQGRKDDQPPIPPQAATGKLMVFLKTYRAKRDFNLTREPRGGKPGKGRRYVIQKHAARRLHYDLRLELDGVMMSWAVTRGPSLVPGEKRLAIHVEDHPVEYNRFEGNIPKDQYGGGTVMIWDRGTWSPEGDPHAAMKKGHLDFTINGKKLKGRFHLVRMRKRPGERQEPWLLIKSDDEFAARKGDRDILMAKPNSVVTGRSIEQIAAANDRIWHSNRAPDDQPEARERKRKASPARPLRPRAKARKARRSGAAKSKTKKAKKRVRPVDLFGAKGGRARAMLDFVPPSLATLSGTAPTGDNWIHEVKFDGYRIQARIANGGVTLKTRTGLEWTERFPGIAQALKDLPVQEVILDGELVAQSDSGISDFSALQDALRTGHQDRLAYYVFDLLYYDGVDLTGASLIDRRRILSDLFTQVSEGPIKLSETFEVPGPVLLEHARRLRLEGIISKKTEAPYHSGRTGDWLKIKCVASQEFVVAGYEPSPIGGRSIRALILGYFDGDDFRYAGRVGTGFTQAVERDLVKRLGAVRSDAMPFQKLPEEERRRKVKWVKPALVAEIDFRGWTHGGVLRQASFKGLREDKLVFDVVREVPKVAAAAQRTPRKASNPGIPRKLAVQKAARVEIAGVILTHPDRVYWRDVGVTKEMLARYYQQVWTRMAPHLIDRPVALVRCPEGADFRKCFFQKHVSAGLEVERLISVPIEGEEPAIAVDALAGLIALVQAGVLEIHTWGTHRQHVEACDCLVFDLDPGPGIAIAELVEGAREVRSRLAQFKLKSFVKTTGGKGLHVVLPIAPADWGRAKDFAHAIADAMAKDNPRRYVSNMAKSKREGRIFVDYLRNGRGATAIAPYSTRARDGAPVAMPLSWDELGTLKSASQFNLTNVPARLARQSRDPWAGMKGIRQTLTR